MMGEFYIKRRQFKLADFYLQKSLTTKDTREKVNIGKTEYLLFKVDSALDNFHAALVHYTRYNRIKDTLFNIAKTNQINELQIEFETAQKEQAIKLLQSQSKYQQAELQSVSAKLKVTIAGI